MSARWLLLGAGLGLFSLSAGANDWPQFRGPGRDNKVVGFTAPETWPKELTKKWKVTVGDGVASPALVGDKVYTFTRQGKDEVVMCLNAETGKEVWKEKYKSEDVKSPASGFPGGPQFTGPRSSPAVGEGKVCTFSVGGIVSCFDAETGKPAWHKETMTKPKFYTSTSPLIVDGKCIVHIGSGSKGEVTAYDLTNGETKWKWSGDGPGYGSPVAATIGGTKQVVLQTDANLVGIALADGKLLWKIANKSPGNYQTGTPIIDGNMVVCAGIGYTIEKSGDEFKAKQDWKEQLPATYNTPVLKEGVLYGLTFGGGGGKGGKGERPTKLFAQDAKTGKELWQDTATRGECGAVLDTGSVLLMLSSDSNLVAFKPDKDEFKQVAKYKVADTPTFAMPIIDGKRIYVKDKDSLILWTFE